MLLTLIRHGETDYNVKKIVQGQANSQLTYNGMVQADKVAQRLSNQHYDLMYCSDLQRTRDTFGPIQAHHLDTPLIYTPRLRERGFGEFEHKHWDDCDWDSLPGDTWIEKSPPGAETLPEFLERAASFVDDVYANSKGKNVLCMTHGGTIRMMVGHIFNMSYEQMMNESFGNTSITQIAYDLNGTPTLLMKNNMSHL